MAFVTVAGTADETLGMVTAVMLCGAVLLFRAFLSVHGLAGWTTLLSTMPGAAVRSRNLTGTTPRKEPSNFYRYCLEQLALKRQSTIHSIKQSLLLRQWRTSLIPNTPHYVPIDKDTKRIYSFAGKALEVILADVSAPLTTTFKLG